MEGVGGGRLGRSSTRYGTGASAAVFSGPVRKWKKRWVPIPPYSTHKPPRNHHPNPNSNAGKVSNTLLLFKWTQTSAEDTPRRRFRYIPIAKLEEQTKEVDEKSGDQSKPNETKFGTTKAKLKKATSEEKPDINDVPMYETQGRGSKVARHDLNEGTFDLSLG